MKIDIEEVGHVLSLHKIDQETQVKILADLEKAKEETLSERAPRKKSNYFLVKPENTASREGSLYLFKANEDYNFTALQDSVNKVRGLYNGTKKGKKKEAKNAVETIESAKPAQWKTEGLKVLLREPLAIIEIKN